MLSIVRHIGSMEEKTRDIKDIKGQIRLVFKTFSHLSYCLYAGNSLFLSLCLTLTLSVAVEGLHLALADSCTLAVATTVVSKSVTLSH